MATTVAVVVAAQAGAAVEVSGGEDLRVEETMGQGTPAMVGAGMEGMMGVVVAAVIAMGVVTKVDLAAEAELVEDESEQACAAGATQVAVGAVEAGMALVVWGQEAAES